MAEVGFEPPTSRSRVRHSTTEPPRSPSRDVAHTNLTVAVNRSERVCRLFERLLLLLHKSDQFS